MSPSYQQVPFLESCLSDLPSGRLVGLRPHRLHTVGNSLLDLEVSFLQPNSLTSHDLRLGDG